ncbi:MAG TPA: SIMPL domain-containing protein [Gammaproteobacteria bacterium]|nr:SIMPL domain-containing protein [Gammaproteobacteria bacterium]
MLHIRHCIALMLLIPVLALADALPAMPYIQVSGHGTLNVVPNMAHISITIEKTDKDLASARADVERRAAQVIEAAKKLGIAERDINATNISVWPEYKWQNNNQIFMGQHVSRRIQITLRALPQYADLVGTLVKAGVNNIGSTTLDRSDMPQLRQQALAKAVDDAHKRALVLAAAAGVNLGAVYSITENSGFNPGPLVMAGRAATTSSGTDYEPGSLDVTADVSIVYLLKKAR